MEQGFRELSEAAGGHPGLYVIDGAIIPGALSSPLSERASQWMIHGKELTERRHVVLSAPSADAHAAPDSPPAASD